MTWLIRWGMRQGWRRGVVDGSRVWTVAGGIALLFHLARRARRSEPDVVFSEKLAPGETFRITVVPPQER